MKFLTILLLLLFGSVVEAAGTQRQEFAQACMGLPVRIILYTDDHEMAQQAARAAFRRFGAIDAAMSDYNPESEIVRLAQAAETDSEPTWQPVSDDLWAVLLASQRFYELSDGAFDVTLGPLTRLWRRSRRMQKLPESALLEKMRQRVGWKAVELDSQNRRIRLTKPGMRFDFGGIAKGYALDAAAEVIRKQGIKSFLVDAGGDVRAGDPPLRDRQEDADGWIIAVGPQRKEDRQTECCLLKNEALAASGDTFQFVEIDGVRYSHLIDPATGLGLTARRFVAVRAPEATTADALASALCVLGPEKGLPLAERLPRVEAMFIDGEKRSATSGWKIMDAGQKPVDVP